jgi:hypothetical protein
LISHVIPLEDAAEAFVVLEGQHAMKVLVECGPPRR